MPLYAAQSVSVRAVSSSDAKLTLRCRCEHHRRQSGYAQEPTARRIGVDRRYVGAIGASSAAKRELWRAGGIYKRKVAMRRPSGKPGGAVRAVEAPGATDRKYGHMKPVA